MTPDEICQIILDCGDGLIPLEDLKATLENEDLSKPSDCQAYPIHSIIAVELGLIDFAIERGADINVQNMWGDTPLHFALDQCAHELAKQLLLKGARVDLDNLYQYQALDLAVHNWLPDQNEIIELILERGGDVDHKDEMGLTARDHAKDKPLCYNPAISPPEFKPID